MNERGAQSVISRCPQRPNPLAIDFYYEQDARFQDFVIVHELLHLRAPHMAASSRR